VIHLDTSFVVDLEREMRRGLEGKARALLPQLVEHEIAISLFARCELAAGAELARRPADAYAWIARVCGPFPTRCPDERLAPTFGRLGATLERAGQRIGMLDLLIAATALLDDATLVTGNAREFGRVPGLRILGY
jgi:tRNA(fMet)-specific endonuclease VapC